MPQKKRVRRQFSQKDKLEIIQLVLNDKKSVPEVVKLLDINRQTIHRWLNEYKELGEKAFIDKSIIPREALIKKQERLLKEKDEEIAFLKKAMAYFAKKRKEE